MIRIKNLSKKYNGRVTVFSNFSYDIVNNLFLLIGSNGSGKTTLLNCIANHISYDGEIEVNGVMSYLPEKRAISEDVVTKDIIKLMERMYSTKADRYVNLLGLSPHLAQKYEELSHGNKTKLMVACTLLKPADVYVFDEPTNGLDLKSKEGFIRLCLFLSEEKRVVISTHDMGVIDKMKANAQVLNLDVQR